MANNKYIGANVSQRTDTFAAWLESHNTIQFDMSRFVVTTDVTPDGGLTQGNVTISSEFADGSGPLVPAGANTGGILSANTLSAFNELRGGSVSTPATLNITSNVISNGSLSTTSANTVIDNSTHVLDTNTATFSWDDATIDGSVAYNSPTWSVVANFVEYTTANFNITGDIIHSGQSIQWDANVVTTETSSFNIIGPTKSYFRVTENVLDVDTLTTRLTTNLVVTGNTTINGGVCVLTSTISSSLVPTTTSTYSLGLSARRFNAFLGTTNTNNLSVTSNVDVGGNLVVSGDTTLEALTAKDTTVDVLNAQSLVVDTTSSLGGNVIVDGLLVVNENITARKQLTLTGNLVVSGDTTLEALTAKDTTVDVLNAQSLVVGGTSALKGNVTAEGQLIVSGNVIANSSISVAGDLSVLGDTALVDVTANTIQSNTLTSSTITSTSITSNVLTVPSITGDTEFTSNVIIQGRLVIEGEVILPSDTIVSSSEGAFGTLTVTTSLSSIGDADFGTSKNDSLKINSVVYTDNKAVQFDGPRLGLSYNQNNLNSDVFGIYGKYSIDGTSPLYSGILRDRQNGRWKLLSDVDTEFTNTSNLDLYNLGQLDCIIDGGSYNTTGPKGEILLPRSMVPNQAPSLSNIKVGEIAINLADRLLYATDGTDVFALNSLQTSANLLNSIKTVDGSGSGLDADTVDGLHASDILHSNSSVFTFRSDTVNGYLRLVEGSTTRNGYIAFHHADGSRSGYVGFGNSSTINMFSETGYHYNFNQNPTVNNSEFWHQGNDGSGSGLDADTLDGLEATSFLNLGTTFQRVLGSKVFGDGDVSPLVGHSNGHIRFGGTGYVGYVALDSVGMHLGHNSTARSITLGVGGSPVFAVTPTSATVNGDEVYHQGNDGAGSGLDADTVDGLHASDFGKITTNENITGQWNFATDVGIQNDGPITLTLGTTGNSGAQANFRMIGARGIESATIAEMTFINNLSTGEVEAARIFVGGDGDVNVIGNLQVSGNEVWHQGNDGSGSGLDADTVDGLHASDFMLSNGTQTLIIDDSTADIQNNGFTIDHNVSGSDVLTADRNHIGLLVDTDSTATGGDVSNEHRLMGIHANLNVSGDSDIVYGLYGNVRSTHTTGQITQQYGLYAVSQSDNTDTSVVANLTGVNGFARQDGVDGTVTSMCGVSGRSEISSNVTTPTNNAIGVYAEVELNSSGTLNIARGVQSIIDHNNGNINTGYLFQGDYQGTRPTNAWGIFCAGDKHYLEGDLFVGGTDTKVWHQGNDGSGSGLDADTLDGLDGSHYLDYNNLTNVPISFDLSADYSLTGEWSFGGLSKIRLNSGQDVTLTSTAHPFQIGLSTSTNIAMDGNEIMARANGVASVLQLNLNGGDVRINNSTAWHAGNDGSGSGLDADTLDGLHASDFRQKTDPSLKVQQDNTSGYVQLVTGTDTRTGYMAFHSADSTQLGYVGFADSDTKTINLVAENGSSYSFNSTPRVGSDLVYHQGNDGAGSGLDADLLRGVSATDLDLVGTIAMRTVSGDLQCRLLRSSFGTQVSTVAPTAGIVFRNDNDTDNFHRVMSGAAMVEWLGSHDGAGSGLDADTLDGLEANQLLRSDALGVKNDGHLTFNDNVHLRFGTGHDTSIFHNGTNQYMDLTTGNFFIRDGAATKFTFARTTGDFTATGEITAFSDETLKRDIKPYEGFDVNKLNVKRYKRKDLDDKDDVGVIAQEVRKYFPEAVVENEYGILSVNYAKLAVAAVASQRDEMTAMKDEIAELKALILSSRSE